MSTVNSSYVNVWRQMASLSDGSGAPTLGLTRDTIAVVNVDLIYSPAQSTPAVVYPLPLGMSYHARMQAGYSSSSPSVAEALDGDWNDPADRPDVDPALGRLCFRIDLQGESLAYDIGSLASKTYHVNLFVMTGDHQGFLGRIPVVCHNVAVEPQEPLFSSSSSSLLQSSSSSFSSASSASSASSESSGSSDSSQSSQSSDSSPGAPPPP